MNDYRISFWLRDCYHCYTMREKNEAIATAKALRRLPSASIELLHDFKCELWSEVKNG